MAQPAPQKPDAAELLDPLEKQVISVFVDAMKALGLPRSIGEIYGLLFITPHPLALDDLVRRLGISKGSASQGLRMLKDLGAVKEADISGERRTYYQPAVELKRLVGGFLREQIAPHLESGKSKVKDLATTVSQEEDPGRRAFYTERVQRLGKWMNRGGKVLPILQKLLDP
ncbi:MAG: hypothetical protein QM680_00620 [Luteolibacter sp.]